jgi:HEPN domain-containing protein
MSPDEKEILLNDFAFRSFCDTADEDYVLARFAYRADLIPQALWSSQQALEKYIKGILLLRRIPWTIGRHSLLKPLEALEKHSPLQLSKDSREFIGYVDDCRADRYLTYPYGTDGLEIVKLDKTVFDVRRYCIAYGPGRTPSGQTRAELDLKHVEAAWDFPPQKYRSPTGRKGPIEQLIAGQSTPARQALLWNNLYFGNRVRSHIRMSRKAVSVNSVLALHPDIEDELRKYVHLPKG